MICTCWFYKRVTEWKILWKNICRKTTAETRGHHQKGRLLGSAKEEEEEEGGERGA